MSRYIQYQRAKWEQARRESEFLAPMGAAQGEDIDLIKRWALMKVEIYKKQGAYPCPPNPTVLNCRNNRALIDGRSMPMLTKKQANALVQVWLNVGQELGESLRQGGKSSAGINKAIAELQSEWGDWIVWVSDRYAGNLYQNKYLFMPATDRITRAIDRYVISLSTGLWVEYNIENAWERLGWAIDNTLGGWIIKPFYITAGAIGSALVWIETHDLEDLMPDMPNIVAIADLMKWSTIGGGLLFLWWVLKPEKKKGGR